MSLSELQKNALEENDKSQNLGQIFDNMKDKKMTYQISQSTLDCHDINEEKESRATKDGTHTPYQPPIHKVHKQKSHHNRYYSKESLKPQKEPSQFSMNAISMNPSSPGIDRMSY